MSHDRNPDYDPPLTRPQEERPRPNPAEDISVHSQPREAEEPEEHDEASEDALETYGGRGAE